MCFFVGNDFLPHMPTLEIREQAIELLLATYKRMLPTLGHLVDGATVHLDRAERFILEVGRAEDAIFSRRMRMLQRQKVGALRAAHHAAGAAAPLRSWRGVEDRGVDVFRSCACAGLDAARCLPCFNLAGCQRLIRPLPLLTHPSPLASPHRRSGARPNRAGAVGGAGAAAGRAAVAAAT